MNLGPANNSEALIFAVEELRAEIQYGIMRAMKAAGVSQSDLARKLGVSPAWVSQILGDDANLTVETIARVFLALDNQCKLSSCPVGEHFQESISKSVSEWECLTVDLFLVSERKPRDTTHVFMKVIDGNASALRPVQVVNDNKAFVASRQLETA